MKLYIYVCVFHSISMIFVVYFVSNYYICTICVFVLFRSLILIPFLLAMFMASLFAQCFSFFDSAVFENGFICFLAFGIISQVGECTISSTSNDIYYMSSRQILSTTDKPLEWFLFCCYCLFMYCSVILVVLNTICIFYKISYISCFHFWLLTCHNILTFLFVYMYKFYAISISVINSIKCLFQLPSLVNQLFCAI